MEKIKISEHINRNYFWDVDFDKLDQLKSRRLIVERVFSLGTSREIRFLLNYYGREEVLQVLKNLNYLDPKTLNFVSGFFGIPLNEFRCYTRKQSNRLHWNC